MESGVRSADSKKDVGVESTKAMSIEEAHNGFFQDLNAIHSGLMERLNETHKKHAQPAVDAQTNIQALHEEYFKAMQAVHAAPELAKQVTAAFEKYKAAVAKAIVATTDPAGLALLSQSMYAVAMYAAQLPMVKGTP